jgi:hypothetical protein
MNVDFSSIEHIIKAIINQVRDGRFNRIKSEKPWYIRDIQRLFYTQIHGVPTRRNKVI